MSPPVVTAAPAVVVADAADPAPHPLALDPREPRYDAHHQLHPHSPRLHPTPRPPLAPREAPGEWVGAGAQALGLQGRIGKGQFGALIAGRDPRDPAARLRPSAHDPKVAAYDLTFSAPKTLSILFAIAPEQVSGELVGCHEEAVRAALGYLEDTAVMVRRGHAGEHVQPGEGLIAAAYRHRMSRALDPQLHTHVGAANMARGPDGRFTALHGAELYRAAKTAGYLYQAHLRALVTERLGLEWGEVRNGAAELAEIERPVIEHFSQRRHEMLREAERGGIGLGSKSAAEHAALATRERKQYGLETHTWREEIRARAGEQGLDAGRVAELVQAGRERLVRGLARRGRARGRRPAGRRGAPDGAQQHLRRARGAAGVRRRRGDGRAGG